jgi:hypothetical protein
MDKVDVMQEMYLIYQIMSRYMAESESLDEFGLAEINSAYRSFCQREPIGGMFLESVLEQLIERVKDRKPF